MAEAKRSSRVALETRVAKKLNCPASRAHSITLLSLSPSPLFLSALCANEIRIVSEAGTGEAASFSLVSLTRRQVKHFCCHLHL